MYVGGIFCYWAKAFNCISNEILLAKIYFYGLWGVSENWFRFCLKKKKKVKPSITTKNFFSDWGTLKDGVP
jgi:hypothetical protein